MNFLPFLIQGMLLGLSAGFSPGPIVVLAITETLRYGKKSGLQVALAPLVEIPILTLLFFTVSKLSEINSLVGWISLIGSALLAYLAWGNWRSVFQLKDISVSSQGSSDPLAFWKGACTNLLSPLPYLVFITIGIPLVLHALSVSRLAFLFLAGSFYSSVIGAQLSLVVIAAKSKNVLRSRQYQWLVKILSLALAVFALKFFWEGLHLLKIIS